MIPGLFIPDPDPDFLPIPDPGVKKGTGSRIWIRNTGKKKPGPETGSGSAFNKKARSAPAYSRS